MKGENEIKRQDDGYKNEVNLAFNSFSFLQKQFCFDKSFTFLLHPPFLKCVNFLKYKINS